MTAGIPILRLRYELDAALRTRSCVARAVSGRLALGEYAELLGQLGAFFTSLWSAAARRLADLALADAAAAGERQAARRALDLPCDAVRLFRRAVGGEAAERLDAGAAFETGVAVVATSWLLDAQSELATRHPGTTTFVDALGVACGACVERLERRVEADRSLAPLLTALAELERGAVLGIEAHLDFLFPAPIVSFEGRLPGPPRLTGRRAVGGSRRS